MTPAHQQGLDAAVAKHQLEVGLVEGALAGLVEHGLADQWGELRDDVVPSLAADEDAAHGAAVADAHRRRAALDLGARGIGHVGAMALARVDDGEAGVTGRAQQRTQGRNDPAQLGDVVAERLAEAAGLEEIALHVDDDEGALGRIDGDRARLCVDSRGSHSRPQSGGNQASDVPSA